MQHCSNFLAVDFLKIIYRFVNLVDRCVVMAHKKIRFLLGGRKVFLPTSTIGNQTAFGSKSSLIIIFSTAFSELQLISMACAC